MHFLGPKEWGHAVGKILWGRSKVKRPNITSVLKNISELHDTTDPSVFCMECHWISKIGSEFTQPPFIDLMPKLIFMKICVINSILRVPSEAGKKNRMNT